MVLARTAGEKYVSRGHRVVSECNGTIELVSRPGEGSTFTVGFPI